LVQFGYFILKTKNYIVFWDFVLLSDGLGFGLVQFGLVLTKPVWFGCGFSILNL